MVKWSTLLNMHWAARYFHICSLKHENYCLDTFYFCWVYFILDNTGFIYCKRTILKNSLSIHVWADELNFSNGFIMSIMAKIWVQGPKTERKKNIAITSLKNRCSCHFLLSYMYMACFSVLFEMIWLPGPNTASYCLYVTSYGIPPSQLARSPNTPLKTQLSFKKAFKFYYFTWGFTALQDYNSFWQIVLASWGRSLVENK